MSRRQVFGALLAALTVVLVAYLATQGVPSWAP